MTSTIKTDIVIIGAGIAGLWLHHRLNDMGLHAILIEKQAIGSGQTLSSQGIIHGGAKYSLNGILSTATSAIADMPPRWLKCLQGAGELDLSGTQRLSNHQLMWSTKGISSKLTSFFSSKALSSKIKTIHKQHYPPFFQDPLFKGHLYQLNEPVLNIHSLLTNLSSKWQHRIIHVKSSAFIFNKGANHHITSLIANEELTISASEFILTSGEGNEALLNELSLSSPKMQRRPLQMVLAKGQELADLYAHCVGTSSKPIATITTHIHTDGDKIWYIGGNIAEEGVNSTASQLIEETKKTLCKILPWAKLQNLKWQVHKVNRAEPAQSNLLRPDTAFVQSTHNIHIAWPTKLALAPNLSDTMIEILQTRPVFSQQQDYSASDQQLQNLDSHFSATIAPTVWDRLFSQQHSLTQ